MPYCCTWFIGKPALALKQDLIPSIQFRWADLLTGAVSARTLTHAGIMLPHRFLIDPGRIKEHYCTVKHKVMGESAHPNVPTYRRTSVLERQDIQLKILPQNQCIYGTSSGAGSIYTHAHVGGTGGHLKP
jgi:hypothetical protein